MAKTKPSAEPIPFATPPDPNRSFVLFPSRLLTAGSAAVSLESLLKQVHKQPVDRQIAEIAYDPAELKLEIHYSKITKE
ncbi:hypothetical protein [Paenibacillus sanguinis]|uniref:hypothetical protein n=1 Tax=Paenibacillus sanguinis TaxID=225906 RepID=UPI000381781A|nr:hypothetical protein [Paenibacillus sanguinis]